MPEHDAALLTSPRGRLAVGRVDDPRLEPDEILVEVGAVAVNPLDWIIQGTGQVTYRWLHTPAVLGADVAGTVLAVGSSVHRFAVGDRVFGLATGTDKGRDPLREGAFQERTVLLERLAAPTPDAWTEEQAAVLPLAVSTAACALFQPAHLGLDLPQNGGPRNNGVVVVWGGSTSVGMNAVQLAHAAGYDVISTASPRNAELVRSIGAEVVIDHNAADAVLQIITAIGDRKVVGAVALGPSSATSCLKILRRTGGTVLAMASTSASMDTLASKARLFPAMIPFFARVGLSTSMIFSQARLSGIRANFVWGSSLRDDQVGRELWGKVLPMLMDREELRPLPKPLVVGQGLGAIQAGLDRQRAGVSARKVVITVSKG